MRVVILVHGVLSTGKNSIGRLAPYFEARGWQAERFEYPTSLYLVPLLTRRRSAHRLTKLALELSKRDSQVDIVAIGHSNGAAVVAKASEYGAPFRAIVFINGAVEQGVHIGKQVGVVLNCRVPTDPVLRLAARIPQPFWGDLGREGFKPNSDERCWDANLGELFLGVHGHNDVFKPANLERVAPWLVRAVEIHAGLSTAAPPPGPA